ncbi:MAG: dephospho-CoA kinase [Bifidobacteriaceae bacterium]|jgi:dephospho-CoA kinase|nr:dephospho-CoA kinase [Bifidobacteriaceae bacterium]
MQHKFIRSAVTGPICSGKTTLSEHLREKGYIIISWDEIYYWLLENDKDLQIKLIYAFSLKTSPEKISAQIILEALREKVFKRDDMIRLLNSITHPKIQKKAFEKEAELVLKYENSFQEAPNPDNLYPLVVHEIPLLYQAGLQSKFDRIYICLASNKVLLDRVQKRYEISEMEAQLRIDATQFNFPIHDDKVIVVNT